MACSGSARTRPARRWQFLCMPTLQEIINATTSTDLTLLTAKSGKPYSADAFSVQFRTWCDEAGLSDCSFHGLRKAACRRLAEAGCSASEIAAISGHATLTEVSRYTKAADQAKLARAALGRIANTSVKPEPTEVSNRLNPLAKIPATFAAIRGASSHVSNLAADRRPASPQNVLAKKRSAVKV